MTQGLAVRNTYTESYAKAEHPLELLVEREPGYRIFFRNLFDLILRRTEPPLFLASQPVYFRRHFYVRTGVHWLVVLESIVWHMAAVPLLLVLWTWSLNWEIRHYPVQKSLMADSHQQLTYYPMDESFPARAGRQREEPVPERSSPHKTALHVAKEQRRSEIEAPHVTSSGSARPDIASSNPTLPAVPLAATTRSQLVLPADLAEVIGPAPDANQLSMRTVASPAASVVAPAPQMTGLHRAGGGSSLPVTVVAPAPAMQGSARMQRMGNVGIGTSAAVPPSPQLPLSEQRAGRGRGNGTLAASGAAVVPPTPSIHGHAFHAGGSGNLVSGAGTLVVPPSPSMGHALVLAGGRGNSLAGTGAQVVPPVPSLRGRVYLAGNSGNSIGGVGASVVPPSPYLGNALVSAGGAGNSLDGDGLVVVPPPPSIGGSGVRGFGTGRIRSFGDVGGSAVPPIPSVGQMTGRGGNGRGGVGSLTGAGEQVVAPAPSIAGSGLGSGGTGRGGGGNSLAAGLGSQVLPPSGMGSGGPGGGNGDGGNALSGAGSTNSAGSGQGVESGGVGSGSLSAGGGTETLARLGTSPIAGNAGGGGSGANPIISSTIPPHAEIADLPAGKTQVVPLRVIQLALALPMTSYFSNYEAFIAERSVNRDTTQLIKLVYIFLPYQRRLTEFGVKPSKTFNLRVTRDPSCDESLISMTWPEGEGRGQPPAESNKDKLPCYRTTADDYRKAWEKVR